MVPLIGKYETDKNNYNLLINSVHLDQLFSVAKGVTLSPREHLVVSGDIFGCMIGKGTLLVSSR